MALPGWMIYLREFWLAYRTHEFVALFWGIAGILSALMVFLLKCRPYKDENGDMSIVGILWYFFTFFVACLFMVFVYKMRMRGFLNYRMGRVGSFICNVLVTIFGGIAAYFHGTDRDGVMAMLFTGVFMFAVVEIGQPHNDFGLGQSFLRLPVFILLGKFKTDEKKGIPQDCIGVLAGSLFVWLICSVWQILLKPQQLDNLAAQGQGAHQRDPIE